jgi:NADH dehydrogenase FAD-containing subunit
MNIPQVTVVDTKTREVIEPMLPKYGGENIEDKDIIQRINRVLMDGGWSYSSLFGKENRRLG